MRSGTWNKRPPQKHKPTRSCIIWRTESGRGDRPIDCSTSPSISRSNQDVAAAGGEPLAHYLAVGAAKGSNPHPLFDTVFYLERNPDVAAAGMNPLEHYLMFGGSKAGTRIPCFIPRSTSIRIPTCERRRRIHSFTF